MHEKGRWMAKSNFTDGTREKLHILATVCNVKTDNCGYLCYICERVFSEPLTLDHIIPQALSGTGDFINGQAICQSCNNAKDKKIIWPLKT